MSFARAVRGDVSGFDFDTVRARDRAIADANVFARYRRLPETPEAKDFVATCAEDATVNRFCPYLTDPEKGAARAPSREARNGLFEALLKLDDVDNRRTNCPDVTVKLRQILDDADADALHSRALYWTWVCQNLAGLTTEAAATRDELWRRYPFNHLTLEVMRSDRDARLNEAFSAPRGEWTVRTRVDGNDTLNDLVRGVEALLESKQFGAAEQILRRAQANWRGAPEFLLYITALAARTGENMPSVHPVWRTGVPLLQAHRQYLRRPMLELLFPRPKAIFATIRGLNPMFDIFDFIGLVHLESALNPRAASGARAYGLTQMLLPTATDRWREMSGERNVEVTKDMLFEPEFSLTLGAFDLTKRLSTFGGNVRLALASYHAGETAVKRWLTEVPAFRDPEVQIEGIFLNREKPQRSSDYVMNARSRGEWYRAIYANWPL